MKNRPQQAITELRSGLGISRDAGRIVGGGPRDQPGPSSRNKIFPRLAGDFLISFLEEFMARSSNKAIQNCKIFVAECLPTRATFASQGGRELIKMFAMAI